MNIRTLGLATVLATTLGAAAVAFAAPPFGPGDGSCNGPMQAQSQRSAGRMAARMDQHFKALADKLKLTAEQKPAWDELMAAMQAQRGQMMGYAPGQQGSGLTAPARHAQQIDMAKARLTHMEQMQPLLDRLYGQLSREQQVIMDKEFGPPAGKRRQS